MFPIALCSIATLYLIGDGDHPDEPQKAAPPDQEEALKTLFPAGRLRRRASLLQSESVTL